MKFSNFLPWLWLVSWLVTMFFAIFNWNIYFVIYHFIGLLIFSSSLSGMVIYFLIPNPIRKIIWDKWLKMGYAPSYEDKEGNIDKKNGNFREKVQISIFVGFTIIPLVMVLNNVLMTDYSEEKYFIKDVEAKIYKGRYKGHIFNVYNDNRKMKFNLKFSQVVNISDLPNPDILDSTIFKNFKNGYYPEPVLQRQSEVLLFANFITIKSRKSILGFVEVADGRCNF